MPGTNTRGLTLLELLLVVLIVGILATAALPWFGDYSRQARIAQQERNQQMLQAAFAAYGTSHKVSLGYVENAGAAPIAYGHTSGTGWLLQLTKPTDAKGNVLGDPVGPSPGPYGHGPYIAEPSAFASLLKVDTAFTNAATIPVPLRTTWVELTWSGAPWSNPYQVKWTMTQSKPPLILTNSGNVNSSGAVSAFINSIKGQLDAASSFNEAGTGFTIYTGTADDGKIYTYTFAGKPETKEEYGDMVEGLLWGTVRP